MFLLSPRGKLKMKFALIWTNNIVFFRPNALIIHYTNNNQVIRDDELVLIDAGCELK